MEQRKILSMVDHTLLAQGATWDEVRTVCDEAVRFGTASVCLAPTYVKQAAAYLQGKTRICTVIGFPNGTQTTEVKCFETMDAIANGADEIDMVINIGMLREKRYEDVLSEIRKIKKVCGEHILKVIIETCLLTEAEKIEMCHIVSESGADYIKTSTGFSTGGATPEDIALFAAHVRDGLGIKAAGGIRSFADAERMIALGATRLGTSRLVALAKNQEANGAY